MTVRGRRSRRFASRTAPLLLVLASVLAPAPGAEAEAADRRPKRLRPVPDPGARDLPAWEGSQMLLVDAKGRVSILRNEPLQVYPLGRDRSPVVLDGERVVSGEGPKPKPRFVRSAATSAKGDSWVILEGATVRWFDEDGERELASADWMADSVTMIDGDPVAFVLPVKLHGRSDEPRTTPPLILRWEGNRWETWVEAEALPEGEDRPISAEARIERAGMIVPSRKGRTWVANRYRYSVRQLSPSGRVLTGIRRDDGTVQDAEPETFSGRDEALRENLELSGRGGALTDRRTTVSANSAARKILAVAEGPDGRLYLLVEDEDQPPHGLAIDRYDPTLVAVERVGLLLQWQGAPQMVAGERGLHLAPFNARDGERRFISWETLDAATWTVLPGVEISSGSSED